VEEKLDHGIVRDKDIRVPIAIIVGYGDSQGFCRLGQARPICNLSKAAVTVIVIDQHGYRWEMVRMAIAAIILGTTPGVVPIPGNIAKHDKIQQPVVVDVDPRRAG
jgi:hypothetical protein